MIKSKRVLKLHSQYAGVVLFTNGEEGMAEEHISQVRLPEQDWMDMLCPRELTVTIEPGDKLNVPGVEGADEIARSVTTPAKERAGGPSDPYGVRPNRTD